MADVVLKPGESPQSLLRRFCKKVMRAGILRDAKRKRYFVSKSEQRRYAKRKAIRREHKRRSRQRPQRRRF